LMPEQYANEMNLYTQRATQPILNNMSSRGILNSSVTGGALSNVLRDTQAKQSDLVKQSNLWAANQNQGLNQFIQEQLLKQGAENRGSVLSREQLYANLIPSLLNALKYSEGSSESTGSSFGGLLPYLMGGQ